MRRDFARSWGNGFDPAHCLRVEEMLVTSPGDRASTSGTENREAKLEVLVQNVILSGHGF